MACAMKLRTMNVRFVYLFVWQQISSEIFELCHTNLRPGL